MPLPRGVHLAALAIHTNPTGQTLFMACSDSKIRRIPMISAETGQLNPSPIITDYTVLDTKGVAPIQAVLVQGSLGGKLELVAGDADGMLTIFSHEQILWHGSFGKSVSALVAHEDASGCVSYVAGDVDGTLASFSQWERGPEWQARLSDTPSKSQVCRNQAVYGTGVRGLASGRFSQPHSTTATRLVAVCSEHESVKFFHCGRLVQEVSVPDAIICITTGYFTVEAARCRTLQVAAGGVGGTVYLISPWGNVETHVISCDASFTTMVTCPSQPRLQDDGAGVDRNGACGPSDGDATPDTLMCAGHFDGVRIYTNGVLVSNLRVGGWVHSMARCNNIPRQWNASVEFPSQLVVLGVGKDRLVGIQV
eukprot:CAMPEP_0114264146 /NCGR_PEP_ID=MMETSP0058-20121206/23000_1 /TAXON_ID=36894 /ORGANISM="Pyramimonas parkeae, CCMP726" /LENGTH=365 /DNA_ID=CAMNT_0001380699 /DNA_START=162 /DNA_END=1259 /DNA_ORIENTATION=-